MIRALLIASCLCLAAPAAAAQDAPAPTPAPDVPAAAPAVGTVAEPAGGDIERGRVLTYTCQGCHGVTGYKNAYPNYHVPKIAGQNEAYLVNALNEYQDGGRKHPTMQAQAEGFSAQDIADIAAFLSSLK